MGLGVLDDSAASGRARGPRSAPRNTPRRAAPMSLRAMLWALHDAECTDALDKLVLWVLSDYADDTGANAYPSVTTIAQTVPCDRATVHRHLRSLEARGLIVRGDQSAVEGLRPDRRPTVWQLSLPGRTVRPRAVIRGRTDDANGVAHGVAPVRPDPKNLKTNQRARASAVTTGAPLGCAAHSERSPACDACLRVKPTDETRKPARPETARQLAAAARAALSQTAKERHDDGARRATTAAS